MMSAGEAGTLLEYIKMGWDCASQEIVLNGLKRFQTDSRFSKLAAETERAFRAFLATPPAQRRLRKARFNAAWRGFERLASSVNAL
jgi:hypothetical protein